MDTERRFYVYAYYDLNGVPVYVGKGTNRRRFDHLRYAKRTNKNTHFLNWIRKYIKENDTDPRIEILEGSLTSEEALQKEIDYIKSIGRLIDGCGTLLNGTDGGDGGTGRVVTEEERAWRREFSKSLWTDERKKELSDSLKGHSTSEETKKKISDSLKGKPLSEETKQKLKIARVGRTPNLGNKHSEDSLKLISESSKKLWQDPEYRARQLENVKGSNNPNSKTYYVVGNGLDEIVYCMKDFCKEYSLVYGSVIGLFNRKKTNVVDFKGYHIEKINTLES